MILKFNPYRRFISAQCIARTIDWMDIIALNWITLQLTGSAVFIAYINFARLMPQLAFAFIIGKIIDTVRSTKLMYIIHIANIVLTICIVSAFVQSWNIWIILLCVMVRSFFQAIDTVQRNALIQSFVTADKLHKAISLNALILNISRLIGPFIGGLLLTSINPNFVLSLPIIGSICVILLNQQLPEVHQRNKTKHKIWSYLKTQPIIVFLMLSSVCAMLFGFSYTIILPSIVDASFDKQTMIYSLFTAMIAAGSIIILCIFMRSSKLTSIKCLWIWSILFIVTIVLLMFIQQTYLYAIVLLFMGLVSQAFRTTNRILVQKYVDAQYRGSVLSISMMDKGFIPLGGILLSFVFEHLGLNMVYLTMICGLLLSLLFVSLMIKKENQYG
ncbi:MFS transporter [Mammaliicoccus sp. Dog046]|uniref:MFS transporter n=1 Tax=Mammaliicoccus sp. Dog046 TaxID=3034233 RepID=UPI002B2624D9|nr:MFS transporter [Mammaliicoccus sp. Dog046]WQK85632.1 MFS transporter [Mammaliicoccus sp. Dog046]